MDWTATLAGVSTTIVGLGGFVIAWRRLRRDTKAGVATDERELRRDTVADRDAFIDQQQERIERAEKRLDNLEGQLEIERLWNRMLVDHIYRQLPPPPPARPTRT